ncbi:MAG: V-type ATP synthase subunit I [Candidatus Micrarchaeota archaeon]
MEPMVKTRVLCANNDLDSVVEALYEFGAIHVTRSKAFSPGQPLSKLERISRMLVKLRAVESTLGLAGKALPIFLSRGHSPFLDELEKEFNSLPVGQVDSIAKEKQSVEAELNELKSRRKELAVFKSLDVDLNKLSSKTSLLEFAVFEITGSRDSVLAKAREYGEAMVLQVPGQNARLLAALEKRHSEKARSALSQFARESTLPFAKESFSREHASVEKRIFQLTARLSELQKQADSLASAYGSKIVFLRKALEVEFKKAELPSKFGQASMASSAEGWVPAKRFSKLEWVLKERLGEKIVVEKVDSGETPPSKLNNVFAVKPFEFMVQFFSLPRYNEIDPTFLTALTFPLFFGMILGDIGYGILLLALGLFLARKSKAGFVSSLGGMLVLSAFSTIIFGVVYAEFFGLEEVFGFHLTPLLSRIHEHGIGQLIALSILVGFLHIALGLVLGIWQGVREKHYNHSFAKAGWMLVEIGFVAFIVNNLDVVLVEFLKPLKILSPPLDLAVFALGILVLVKTEGVIQLFEIPSLIGNVMSYLRLMALGLSGVALAGIINTIPVDLNSLSSFNPLAWVGVILALVFLVLGHILVCALGLLEAGIQSLRLHYVEFYSKFYKGGGIPFTPLREE